MGKRTPKLEMNNVDITVNGNDIIVTRILEETGEEQSVSLSEGVSNITKAIKQKSDYLEDARFNICIKEYKEPFKREPIPKYIYSCGCDEFESKNDGLDIICKKCGKTFSVKIKGEEC